ncbi:hypothetical protein LLG96_18235 [bacterium]|nr:hypothetical protein [bacterium]
MSDKRVLFFAVILLFSLPCEAELLMDTHGMVSFAPYVQGIDKTMGLYPGYRAEFTANVDFYRRHNLFITGLVGNTTMISRSESSIFTLDKIRYTVSPAFRYETKRWLVRGAFNHESVYSISQSEKMGGAFWQNSIRLGAGSKGAYYLYLRDEYKNANNVFLNTWDAQINGGVFLHGSRSVWSAQNQNYRYELFSLVRYHVGVFNNWVYFATLRQHLWRNADRSLEHKLQLTINAFRKGAVNFFGLFYTFTMYDTTVEDNEKGLGALGLRVLF